LRRLVDLAPRQAVDDAGVARVLVADEAQQLGARVGLVDDRVADVGPVEARHEHLGTVQGETRDDLRAGLRVGGGGQRDARHLGKALVQQGKLKVLRAEVVPPLRHAVRLVDGEQRNAGARQQVEAARRGQSFGRDVQQIELAVEQCAFHRARGAGIQRRVQAGGAHAELGHRRDLVLHQRDQRRYHHAGALAQQRRHLVAQRLAPAGGHQHQRVAAEGDALDDGRLGVAEAVVAERLAQYRERAVAQCGRAGHRAGPAHRKAASSCPERSHKASASAPSRAAFDGAVSRQSTKYRPLTADTASAVAR
jgi:hypothetical protein